MKEVGIKIIMYNGLKKVYTIYNHKDVFIDVPEVTGTGFASSITNAICNIYKCDDHDSVIYNTLYDIGCHILSLTHLKMHLRVSVPIKK